MQSTESLRDDPQSVIRLSSASVISSCRLARAATKVLAFARGALAGCETVLFSLAWAVYSRDKLKTELDTSSNTRSAFAQVSKAEAAAGNLGLL